MHHIAQLPNAVGRVWQRQQRDDNDQIRQNRTPGSGKEASPTVKEGVCDPGQSVEKNLNEKDPGQGRSDRPEQVWINVVSDIEREDTEDEGGADHGHDREYCEQNDSHRDDDVR